jgi:hypothetical protein
LFLTAERNAGELEGDLWEDVELEMHIEEAMDTIPQISDDQSDTQSSQLHELQSEDLEPKSMELSITAVFFGFEAESVFLDRLYEVEDDYSMNPHPCPCVHPHLIKFYIRVHIFCTI